MSKLSRKRSALVASAVLVLLGLVSAGFLFFPKSAPEPAATPTTITTQSPRPEPNSEPSTESIRQPNPDETQHSLLVSFKGVALNGGNEYAYVTGRVDGNEQETMFVVPFGMLQRFEPNRTYTVIAFYNTPDGLPRIVTIQ